MLLKLAITWTLFLTMAKPLLPLGGPLGTNYGLTVSFSILGTNNNCLNCDHFHRGLTTVKIITSRFIK